METSQILLENCQNDKHSLQIGQIKANFLYIYYKLSLDLSAFTMELQRMHSQRGKVLFPHWVIVSLARFHKGLAQLKECLMFNKGRLLKIKRHLSKTSPSLPQSARRAHKY